MVKKILVVAGTTEARAKARIDLKNKWGDEADIRTAGFEHAVGVCKEITPCMVVMCHGAGGSVAYDKIKETMPHQRIVRVGYDPLPATL